MATQGCCGIMGPMAGVSAYLAYLDIKQKVQSVFGLKTYAQGAVDKVNNTIHKRDPGYVANVPEKVRAIHDKIMDDKADNKAYAGALQWGSANMTAMTTVMGALQGPVGNSLGTVKGPIDGFTGIGTSESKVYRVFGGDAKADGFSWTPTNTNGVANFREAAGLPSGGASGSTNTGQFVIEGTVDFKNIITSHPAQPLDGRAGGGVTEYIINPNNVKKTRVSGANPAF